MKQCFTSFIFILASSTAMAKASPKTLPSIGIETGFDAKIKDVSDFVKSNKSGQAAWLATTILQASSLSEKKDLKKASLKYLEIVKQYDRDLGKYAFSEFLKLKLENSSEIDTDIKKVLVQLNAAHQKSPIPLFRRVKAISRADLDPFLGLFGMQSQKAKSPSMAPSTASIPASGLPSDDPLLLSLSKQRCEMEKLESDADKKNWLDWEATLPAGLNDYLSGLIDNCRGRSGNAESKFKKVIANSDLMTKFPAQYLWTAKSLALLQRRAVDRFVAIDTFRLLAKLWNANPLTPENSKMDATAITYEKANDLAWACRVLAWRSEYSEAQSYCENSIETATTWTKLPENKTSKRYQSFAELVAEGYQTLADRILTEKQDWSGAQKIMTTALASELDFGSSWTGRLKWHLAFYTWLDKDYKNAEGLFLSAADSSANRMDQERGVFWAARAAKAQGNEDRYKDLTSRLRKDFPISFYTLVLLPQLEGTTPSIPGLSSDLLVKRLLLHEDIAATLNKSQDKNLKLNFETLNVLIAFDIQPFAALLARDIHDQIKESTSLNSNPELWILSAKALLSAGDASKGMAVASQVGSTFKDVSQKKPDLLFYIYPRPYLELYQLNAEAEKLPISLLLGISRQESTFAPAIVSPAKAIGLMQLIVATADRMAKAKGLILKDTFEELQNPAVNITLGSAYLGLLLKHYQQNEVQAVAAYNAGEGMIDLWMKNRILPDQMAWIEAIPFGETRNYVKTVLRNRAVYDLLSAYHGASALKTPTKIVGRDEQHLKKTKKL